MITNTAIVFIAVFAFPLLSKLDETPRVGYLTTQIIGDAVMMFGMQTDVSRWNFSRFNRWAGLSL